VWDGFNPFSNCVFWNDDGEGKRGESEVRELEKVEG
jgi:hypothetical protein